MPDAVLLREQGDGGSMIDGDFVGGRMGLLFWSWVNRSFSTISPPALRVNRFMMFIGAMHAFGRQDIFPHGMTSPYPNLMLSEINFFNRTGFMDAPLWFPNVNASLRSSILLPLLKLDKGHLDPLMRRPFIRRCWCWDCFLPYHPDYVNEVGWESSLAGICSMFGLVVGLVAGILVV